jgi:hypothetical protein
MDVMSSIPMYLPPSPSISIGSARSSVVSRLVEPPARGNTHVEVDAPRGTPFSLWDSTTEIWNGQLSVVSSGTGVPLDLSSAPTNPSWNVPIIPMER